MYLSPVSYPDIPHVEWVESLGYKLGVQKCHMTFYSLNQVNSDSKLPYHGS